MAIWRLRDRRARHLFEREYPVPALTFRGVESFIGRFDQYI